MKRTETPARDWRREHGHAVTEYALILGLIVFIVFTLFRVGTQTGNLLTAVNKGFEQQTATSAAGGQPPAKPTTTAASPGRPSPGSGGAAASSNDR